MIQLLNGLSKNKIENAASQECSIYIASVVVTANDGPTDIFPNSLGNLNIIKSRGQICYDFSKGVFSKLFVK
jgi:hypothetical protein